MLSLLFTRYKQMWSMLMRLFSSLSGKSESRRSFSHRQLGRVLCIIMKCRERLRVLRSFHLISQANWMLLRTIQILPFASPTGSYPKLPTNFCFPWLVRTTLLMPASMAAP